MNQPSLGRRLNLLRFSGRIFGRWTPDRTILGFIVWSSFSLTPAFAANGRPQPFSPSRNSASAPFAGADSWKLPLRGHPPTSRTEQRGFEAAATFPEGLVDRLQDAIAGCEVSLRDCSQELTLGTAQLDQFPVNVASRHSLRSVRLQAELALAKAEFQLGDLRRASRRYGVLWDTGNIDVATVETFPERLRAFVYAQRTTETGIDAHRVLELDRSQRQIAFVNGLTIHEYSRLRAGHYQVAIVQRDRLQVEHRWIEINFPSSRAVVSPSFRVEFPKRQSRSQQYKRVLSNSSRKTAKIMGDSIQKAERAGPKDLAKSRLRLTEPKIRVRKAWGLVLAALGVLGNTAMGFPSPFTRPYSSDDPVALQRMIQREEPLALPGLVAWGTTLVGGYLAIHNSIRLRKHRKERTSSNLALANSDGLTSSAQIRSKSKTEVVTGPRDGQAEGEVRRVANLLHSEPFHFSRCSASNLLKRDAPSFLLPDCARALQH